MTEILCNGCGKFFKARSLGDNFTTINACPYCKKSWKLSKVSGIKWKVYPKLFELVLSYTKIKR